MKIIKAPKDSILTSNPDTSAKFYEQVLELKTELNSDGTLEVDNTVSLKQETPWVVHVMETKRRVSSGNRTTEILIESDSLEELIEKNKSNPQFRIIDPPGCKDKDTLKIYDPDNHIIEIRKRFQFKH